MLKIIYNYIYIYKNMNTQDNKKENIFDNARTLSFIGLVISIFTFTVTSVVFMLLCFVFIHEYEWFFTNVIALEIAINWRYAICFFSVGIALINVLTHTFFYLFFNKLKYSKKELNIFIPVTLVFGGFFNY
ncbi:hypothetical protein FACS189459_5610 [Bacilli bacterium]|nr:hypothetical protein FACS189459_5610 [Bacilli bacterium]